MRRVYESVGAFWRALVAQLEDREGSRQYRFWLFVTIFFWVLPQLLWVKTIAKNYPYIVHNDARQFVVWLRRQSEPGIYPSDPLAEHFNAVTPWLYQALYWPFGKLGIDPLIVEPLILLPAMAIVWSIVCFNFVHRLWPSAAGAAIATIALSYMLIAPASLGLPKGAAQASVLLLLLLFLDRRIALIGPAVLAVWGMYPVAGIVAALSMSLLMLRPDFPYVTAERAAWITLIVAGMFTLIGASFFLLSANRAGPTITIEEARKMPNFRSGGRTEFFDSSFTRFYLCNSRSGLFGSCGGGRGVDAIQRLVVVLAIVTFGLWLTGSRRARSLFIRFGVPPPDPRLAAVVGALAISGLILFALAHAFAFSLHLPARYAKLTLRLDYALVIAICVAASILAVARRIISLDRAGLATASVVGLLLITFFAFSLQMAKRHKYESTHSQAIHEWLRTTPKDTLVAGFAWEIDSVPAFGRRSVFGSLELMVPYKRQNFELIAERMNRLGRALYAADSSGFAQLVKNDKIDYILINRDAAREVKDVKRWAKNVPPLKPSVHWLRDGGKPFFSDLIPKCQRAQTADHILLDAACLVEGRP